jgi:hypothetical protein
VPGWWPAGLRIQQSRQIGWLQAGLAQHRPECPGSQRPVQRQDADAASVAVSQLEMASTLLGRFESSTL